MYKLDRVWETGISLGRYQRHEIRIPLVYDRRQMQMTMKSGRIISELLAGVDVHQQLNPTTVPIHIIFERVRILMPRCLSTNSTS